MEIIQNELSKLEKLGQYSTVDNYVKADHSFLNNYMKVITFFNGMAVPFSDCGMLMWWLPLAVLK